MHVLVININNRKETSTVQLCTEIMRKKIKIFKIPTSLRQSIIGQWYLQNFSFTDVLDPPKVPLLYEKLPKKMLNIAKIWILASFGCHIWPKYLNFKNSHTTFLKPPPRCYAKYMQKNWHFSFFGHFLGGQNPIFVICAFFPQKRQKMNIFWNPVIFGRQPFCETKW